MLEKRLFAVSNPEPIEISRLGEYAGDELAVLLYPLLGETIAFEISDRVSLIDADISKYLGRAAIFHDIAETAEPLFVGKQK